MEESGGREVQDSRKAGKLNEGVAFEDLEECVKRAAENCPAQVIQVGPPAVGLDPV